MKNFKLYFCFFTCIFIFCSCTSTIDSSSSYNHIGSSTLSTIESDILNSTTYLNLDFLTKEQLLLFLNNQDYIYMMLYNSPSLRTILISDYSYKMIYIDGYEYYLFDISYDTFEQNMLNIFTPDILLNKLIGIKNYNNKLALLSADGGFSAPDYSIYTLLEQTDTCCKFQIEGLHITGNDNVPAEVFSIEEFNELKNKCQFTTTKTITLSLIGTSWVISEII